MRAIRRMKRMAVVVFVATIFVTAPAIFSGQAQPAKTTQTHSRTTHMTDPGLMHPATLTAKAPATFDAKFTTTKGDFVVHVTRAWAPQGADRFYNLVKHGFFTDAAFFRVVPGFHDSIRFLSADPAVSKEWQNSSADQADDLPVTQTQQAGLRHVCHCRAEYAYDAIVHQLREQCVPGFTGLRSIRRSNFRVAGRGEESVQRIRRKTRSRMRFSRHLG